MVLEVGQEAPLFTLPAHDGSDFSLESYRGSYVVVYFYPKNKGSKTCTNEAISFRDAANELEKLNMKVVGVNQETVESHHAFRRKNNLMFPLLCDADGEVSQGYGAWVERKSRGKTMMGVARSTTLVGPSGAVVAHYPKAKVNDQVHTLRSAVRNEEFDRAERTLDPALVGVWRALAPRKFANNFIRDNYKHRERYLVFREDGGAHEVDPNAPHLHGEEEGRVRWFIAKGELCRAHETLSGGEVTHVYRARDDYEFDGEKLYIAERLQYERVEDKALLARYLPAPQAQPRPPAKTRKIKGLGELVWTTELNWWSGVIRKGKSEIEVHVELAEDASDETLGAAAKSVREHLATLANLKAYAADRLMDHHRDWCADFGTKPVSSKVGFTRKLKPCSVVIREDHETSIEFLAGSLFAHHRVKVIIGPDGEPVSARI